MGFLLRYGSKDLQEGRLYGRIAAIFLSLGHDPPKEKCGLATRDYTRRLYEISLLEKPIITFIHNTDTVYNL